MTRIAVTRVSIGIAAFAACSMDMGVKAPSNLTATALDGGAHLVWKDNSDNESQFMIERKTGTEAWAIVGMVPFDTTQFHDPSLTPGTTYTYRVMAMPKSGGHETGKGAYSEEVMVTAAAANAPGTDGGNG